MPGDTKFLKTNIPGVDALFHGGIPEKSQVLIGGNPGTGKTLLPFEILYRAAKNGVQSTFIALDEDPQNIIKNAKLAFADLKDIDKLVNNGTLSIVGDTISSKIATTTDPDSYSFGSLVSDMEDIIKSNKAKIVAIDSISFIKMMLGKSLSYNRAMISIVANMRRLGVTSFFTSEIYSPDRKELAFSEDNFLFDGLIAMHQIVNDQERLLAMEVIKIRGVSHSRALVPYEITPEGFKLSNV